MLIRLLSLILGIAGFIAAVFFLSFLFLAGAVLGLGLWGWLAWKTRHLRGPGPVPPGAAPPDGHVIEGEYRVEEHPELPAPPAEAEPSPHNKDGSP